MNEPSWFKKKPVQVQAMQWTGDNINALWDWIGASWLFGPLPQGDPLAESGRPARLFVAANDGWLDLTIGEWIIKDASGFYPCLPDRFSETYEPVKP